MIIGVLSDSHGNHVLLQNAVTLLDRCGATRLYHLGDNYADVDDLIAEGRTVGRVPGIYASEYQDSSVPNKLTETIEGIRFMFVHAERDVTGADLSLCDVVCVGHTHLYELRDEPHHLIVNPGHLEGPTSKDRPPSCAVVEIDEELVTARILGLDGTVFAEVRKDFRSGVAEQTPDPTDPGSHARVRERRKRKERRRMERRKKRDETAFRQQNDRRRRERRQRVRRRRDRHEPEMLSDGL